MAIGLFIAIALGSEPLMAASANTSAAAPAAGGSPVGPDSAATPTASTSPLYGPALPPVPKPPATQIPKDSCADLKPNDDTREIVVCAQRPQGYRLNPDILEAQRKFHNRGNARPRSTLPGDECATVGPMGCRGNAGINVLAAAATLAKMADRLSKGQEIGSMFITDPQPTEYQLYLQAKHDREAREAEAAAKAKAKAIAASQGAAAPSPGSVAQVH